MFVSHNQQRGRDPLKSPLVLIQTSGRKRHDTTNGEPQNLTPPPPPTHAARAPPRTLLSSVATNRASPGRTTVPPLQDLRSTNRSLPTDVPTPRGIHCLHQPVLAVYRPRRRSSRRLPYCLSDARYLNHQYWHNVVASILFILFAL